MNNKYKVSPTKLVVPPGTDAILDEYAYADDYDLQEADLRGALYIGPYCFLGCEDLEVVTLGRNIESISDLAFEGSGIQKFIFDGTLEELEKFKDRVDVFREDWVNEVPITCLKEA